MSLKKDVEKKNLFQFFLFLIWPELCKIYANVPWHANAGMTMNARAIRLLTQPFRATGHTEDRVRLANFSLARVHGILRKHLKLRK